ncbi:MAG: MFS transporter [Promethearchaeota archaeon]|nr:MAG: MFS transporter [Candidatus Lokiarchaeota archaeon]
MWSLFTFLTIFSTDFYSLLFFQLIAAIGFGSALPLIFSLTVDIGDIEKRGSVFGRLSAVYVLGNGLGHILSGYLIESFSWTLPFILIAIAGFFCTIALCIMKEPERRGIIQPTEIEDESVLGMSYKLKLTDFKEIWRIKTIFFVIVLNFFMFIAIGAISSNFITMLKNDYQLSSSFATTMLVIIFGSQMISGPIMGKLGDKKHIDDKNGRIKITLLCLLGGSTFYIIAFSLVFANSDMFMLFVFFLLLFIGAFLFGGIDPLLQATLGDVSPAKIRSTVYSLNFLVYTIGRSLSILILAGFFLSFNNLYRPGYLILSIIALSCSLFLIIILNTLPKDLGRI